MSDRETAVLQFIKRYKKANDGNSPTVREICDGVDISSTSMVSLYLERLAEQGKIELRGDGVSRGIVVVGGRWVMGR